MSLLVQYIAGLPSTSLHNSSGSFIPFFQEEFFQVFNLLSSLAQFTMISPKKLLKIAKKWQRLAALNRKRISFPRGERNDADPSSRNNMTSVAEKGHFVVYTADQIRFMFPMSYLNNQVFRELLAMSEEEFGLPGNGPLTLPCDAVFLEYAVSLIRRKVDKETEKVLAMSISTSTRCSSSYSHYPGRSSQYLLVPSF